MKQWSDGQFVVTHAAFSRALANGSLFGGIEVVPPSASDPDAFSVHGSEFAIDRWADDGGRNP